jgi:P27 family predicted phage terminase small subunit
LTVGDAPALVAADPVALAVWASVIDSRAAGGHLQPIDRPLLEAYCLKYAQWRRFEEAAATEPPITRTPAGYPVPNPMIAMANKAAAMFQRLGSALGVTPTTRAKVPGAVPDGPAPVDAFTAWQGQRHQKRGTPRPRRSHGPDTPLPR